MDCWDEDSQDLLLLNVSVSGFVCPPVLFAWPKKRALMGDRELEGQSSSETALDFAFAWALTRKNPPKDLVKQHVMDWFEVEDPKLRELIVPPLGGLLDGREPRCAQIWLVWFGKRYSVFFLQERSGCGS
jgi:hypothetical protein